MSNRQTDYTRSRWMGPRHPEDDATPDTPWLRSLTDEQRRAWNKDQRVLANYKDIWNNAGRVDPHNPDLRMTLGEMLDKDAMHTHMMRDAMTSTSYPHLTERVVSEQVREALEPAAVIHSQVYAKVDLDPGMIVVNPATEGITASDVAEGSEYPERELTIAADEGTTLGKWGLALKMTDEALRWSRFDLLNRGISASGKAMIRHREQKAFDELQSRSTILLSNSSTSYPSSTGRNAGGSYNGTLNLDDLFRVVATMIDRGFAPTRLLMHPSAWQVFANESIAKAFGLSNGLVDFARYQLPNGTTAGSAWSAQDPLVNQPPDTPSNVQTLKLGPSRLFPTLQEVIASPWLPFSDLKTDIYLLGQREDVGYWSSGGEVETEEWRQPERDIQKIKFRQYGSFDVVNEGLAVGRLQDIKVARSRDFTTNIQTQFLTGDFPVSEGLSMDFWFSGVPSDL